MRAATVLLVLTSTLTAGCAVGPDYHRPDVIAPTKFFEQAQIDGRDAPTPADLSLWWQGFDDPLLTQLVAQALQNNLDVAQATARVKQSRAALSESTAALLPSGNISGEGARVHQSLETPEGQLLNGSPNFNRNGEFYEADLGASWELDFFGGRRRDRQAARADYQSSVAGVAAAKLAVAAQTADTYLEIRGLQARIAIARQQIETQRQLVAIVKLQFDSGVAAELQLRQAQGALSQVQASVPGLESAEDEALNAMDVLLGVQPGTYRSQLMKPGAIPIAPAIANAGGPADLIRRRPDLISAERRLAASSAHIGSAISEYYPTFSLSGLLGTATTTAGNEFTSGANQYQGVLGFRWRLFDFGRINAEIAAARGQNAEALAAYRLAVLRASEDVEDAFSAVIKRESQEALLGSGEKSLTRARDVSLVAYKGGVVSLIDVLDADRRLQETSDARAQAQTEAALAVVASFRALGGGWNAATVDHSVSTR